VHVTDDTVEINGVDCRVVVDVVLEVGEEESEVEYEPVEVTDDWFAQDEDGDVYYCGEIARNFEDGFLTDLDGSFRSGVDYSKAGVLIRKFPVVDEAHRQEWSLDIAEDIIQYVDLGATPTEEEGGENEEFPCEGGCLQTLDFSPLEPDGSEFKYYLPGTGFVLAVAYEDEEPTGEREELVCVGSSLDVLGDSACEIDDVDELLDELCDFAPDAFCDEED
jgi:hypothetical protein